MLAQKYGNLGRKRVYNGKHVREAVVCDEQKEDTVYVLHAFLVNFLTQIDQTEYDGDEYGLNDSHSRFHRISGRAEKTAPQQPFKLIQRACFVATQIIEVTKNGTV